MGATYTGPKSGQTRHGLIAMLAIKRGRAIRERREREAADAEAREADKAEARPKKRGWFR